MVTPSNSLSAAKSSNSADPPSRISTAWFGAVLVPACQCLNAAPARTAASATPSTAQAVSDRVKSARPQAANVKRKALPAASAAHGRFSLRRKSPARPTTVKASMAKSVALRNRGGSIMPGTVDQKPRSSKAHSWKPTSRHESNSTSVASAAASGAATMPSRNHPKAVMAVAAIAKRTSASVAWPDCQVRKARTRTAAAMPKTAMRMGCDKCSGSASVPMSAARIPLPFGMRVAAAPRNSPKTPMAHIGWTPNPLIQNRAQRAAPAMAA